MAPGWQGAVYIALDRNLMAAEIQTRADNIEVGSADLLVRIVSSNAASTAGYPYEVSPDGQRILAMVPDGARVVEPVTLIQAWTAALKE